MTRGTPIAPADQMTMQSIQAWGCTAVLAAPFLLLSFAYVLIGLNEQRNPMVFDLENDQVWLGNEAMCKASAIRAIRLVSAPGGKTGGTGPLGKRTFIFAKLDQAPWSIQLGGFTRMNAARSFAEPIGAFPNVRLYEDPIVLQKNASRGFPIVASPGAK